MAQLFFSEKVALLKKRSDMTGNILTRLPRKTASEDSQKLLSVARSTTESTAAPAVGDYVRWQKIQEGGAIETRWYRIEAVGKTITAGTYAYMQDTTYYRATTQYDGAELAELLKEYEAKSQATMSQAMNS